MEENMGKIRNFFGRFFAGRHGLDNLGKINIVAVLLFLILLNVAYAVGNQIFLWTVRVIYILLIVILFFRILSKNHVKRTLENQKYLKLKESVKSWFRLQKQRIKDRKTHVYRKCPYCRAVLRLKRIKGKHRAACPKCGASFEVNVR